jgi:signal transduction histidine kinase
MDSETLRKLFDPFFTTKFVGRGLGMPEVIGIVKGHHGALFVDSQVGKGTTIRVLLPVKEKNRSAFV